MQNSNIHPTQQIEEDEIDLRELWQTIKKGKKLIALVTTTIVTITLIYALSMPNVYKSEAILIPTAQEGGGGLGGLGGLAAMAGVSVGGGSMTPDVAFDSLLNNYEFMKQFVTKNRVYEYYSREDFDADYVFALGFRGIYDARKPSKDDEDEGKEIDLDEEQYKLIKKIQKSLSISADKKSGLITISYSDSDRAYPPEIIKYFLRDASEYLVKNNLKNIDQRLSYFQKELNRAEGFELRQSLSQMISKIVQEKVMMQSKQYYQCDVLAEPTQAYIKDKAKPKRGLILVVSFVTSIILGIFLVFLLNFIRGDEEGEKE